MLPIAANWKLVARATGVAIAWTLLLFGFTFLQGSLALWAGVALVVIGAPSAVFTCCSPALSRRHTYVVMLTPVLVGAVFHLTYLIPPPPLISVGIWLVSGGVGGLLYVALLLRSKQAGAYGRTGLAALAVFWWSCWAVAAAAATPVVSHDTPEDWCLNKLKVVATAAIAYEESNRELPGLDRLLQAGLVKSNDIRCPAGSRYGEIIAATSDARQTYWLVCGNHPHLLMVTRSGHVRVFREMRHKPPKYGPKPWWL